LSFAIEVEFRRNAHTTKSTYSAMALTRTLDLDAPGGKFGIGAGKFR
jgi:hypothetical protein